MLQVGTILHGTYKIESYLASGGFGNTYLAKNIEFDETYAIKEFFVKGVCQRDGNSTTISVSNAENTNSFEQQREKFKKEARRLRSLSNPHIVKVYDLFEENGTAYYVMDYVDGENLSARLKRTNAPLVESEVRNYLNQILDGLEAIHNEGMFHLDIKPANIMVDSHDVVKLIDFGASKQQSTVGGATMSTGISYTNGYAPSEQMAQSYDKFGPWTDFYALGATMYKLLTNQDPPSVSDLSEDETEDKHLALPMPNVSGEMKKLVVWMMQEKRLKRPKNVGEIRRILQQSSVATSNNEETKVFSPHQSYANSVSEGEETQLIESTVSQSAKGILKFQEIVSEVSFCEIITHVLIFTALIGLFYKCVFENKKMINGEEDLYLSIIMSVILSIVIFALFIFPNPFQETDCGGIHMLFVKKRLDSYCKNNPQNPYLKYMPRISNQMIVLSWVSRIVILLILILIVKFNCFETVEKILK